MGGGIKKERNHFDVLVLVDIGFLFLLFDDFVFLVKLLKYWFFVSGFYGFDDYGGCFSGFTVSHSNHFGGATAV